MLEIFLWMLLFIIGYSTIFFAADLFLDNLKDLCLIYKVSPFIIGLVVLGLDPEETIASVVAAANGLPFIAMGNVIGNSIISLTLCFALPAFIHEIKFKKISQFYFLIINLCMIIILISFFMYLGLLFFGIVAIGLYLVYVIRSLRVISREGEIDVVPLAEINEELEIELDKEGQITRKSRNKKIFLVIISFALIVIGGELLIFSADNLIELTGISEAFFGFIIIAFVTNVEELTLIFKSIKKKSVEIGLGGMIGKIIWNLTLTFGLSGVIAMNISFQWVLLWNWLILLITIIYFNIITVKKRISWKDGIVLILIFLIFMVVNLISL